MGKNFWDGVVEALTVCGGGGPAAWGIPPDLPAVPPPPPPKTHLNIWVTDADNKPIGGASVFLDGGYIGTTWSDGRLDTYVVPESGSHRIRVAMLGYPSAYKDVILHNGYNAIDVTMSAVHPAPVHGVESPNASTTAATSTPSKGWESNLLLVGGIAALIYLFLRR